MLKVTFGIFVATLVLVASFPTDSKYKDDHAEELEHEFQGDMIITQEELDAFNGRIDVNYKWPDNVIPYSINMSFLNEEQAAYIHKAADTINALNCLKLVNRTYEKDYVVVSGESTGCSSYVGRQGGPQLLRLAPNVPESGCFRLYTIVHEFIHAFGFHHMQSSHDRDQFVQIVWENIQSGTENNFNLYGKNYIDHFGVKYDYGSVMHYSATSFSVNGGATIVPIQEMGNLRMGQRDHMSESDILRIKRMYGCLPSPDRA